MLDNITIGAHDRMKMYLVMWFLIAMIFIMFFVVLGVGSEPLVCVDGSIPEEGEECPQCTEDSHCGIDGQCIGRTCRARLCNFDDDCLAPRAQCIFSQCVVLGGPEEFEFEFDN